MSLFKIKKFSSERGAAAILITMLILTLMLTISLVVAGLMVQEVRISRDIAGSFKAYEMALAGIERGSYKIKDGGCSVTDINGCSYSDSAPDGSSYNVKFNVPAGDLISKGQKDTLERQIEVSIYHVTAVAAGSNHSLALRSDGTVWAWGDNSSGQLGTGVIGGVEDEPVQVGAGVVGFENIKAIAAGGAHSLALKSDGKVWAWGENANCQLGNGNPLCGIDSAIPTKVQKSGGGDLNDIISINAGFAHSLAIQKDALGVITVWSWGNNSQGQLGYDTLGVDREYASKVLGEGGFGDLNDIVSVAAGDAHSVAVHNTGNVFAWGLNNLGQLGDSTGINSNTPVRVKELVGILFVDLTNIKAVASGLDAHHSLALRTDGTVWAWGDDSSEQLGNGASGPSSYAIQVSVLTNVNTIATGNAHSLAIDNANKAWAWGSNNKGQLGKGNSGDVSNIPIPVHGLNDTGNLTDVILVAGGAAHSLAGRIAQGKVLSWGDDSNEQLGNGTGGNSLFPIKVNGF